MTRVVLTYKSKLRETFAVRIPGIGQELLSFLDSTFKCQILVPTHDRFRDERLDGLVRALEDRVHQLVTVYRQRESLPHSDVVPRRVAIV